MADPTGTIGAMNQDGDLALATKGGPRFMERIRQLCDAADRHEQALAQLHLGQEAVAALKEAAEQREAATAAARSAAAELASAQEKAKDIVAQADRERAAAEGLRRDVEAQLERAREKEQRATEADAAARAAGGRAAMAQRAAEDMKKKFTDKIDRLKDALSRV